MPTAEIDYTANAREALEADARAPKYQIIRMADHEWSSHENGMLMHRIAEEALRADNSPLLVEVIEHAGWFQTYALINGEVHCVSSANDRAQFQEPVASFRRSLKGITLNFLPEIRR